MSIEVRFYTGYSKRINSTKKPANTDTFTKFDCTLKEGCNILNPEIEIYLSSGDPSGYNYAHIPSFGRYYFVSDWTYFHGTWTASLSEDILASFKTEIGALSKYIMRSASAFNTYIPDMLATKLPTKTKLVVVSSPFTNAVSSNDGFFIIGIQGEAPASNVPTIGGVCYYPLNPSQMRAFSDYLMSGSFADLMKDDSAGLTQQVVKALQDPSQYIVSCMWFPFASYPTTIGNVQPRIGWWNTAPLPTNPNQATVGMGANGFISLMDSRNITITIPDHPQLSSGKYGKYLNAAPYSLYSLMFEPWGEIVLDGSKLVECDSLKLVITTDLMTGAASLTIIDNGTSSPNKGNIIDRRFAQVGVPISIAQMIYDISDLKTGAAVAAGTAVVETANKVTDKWMADAIKEAGLEGNPAVAGFESTYQEKSTKDIVQNAMSSGIAYIATPEMKGISGDVLNYYSLAQTSSDGVTYYPQGPYLKITYFEVVEPDNAENGRPLMNYQTINTLSGFVKCADGDHNIAALNPEQRSISSYLSGGFFYE